MRSSRKSSDPAPALQSLMAAPSSKRPDRPNSIAAVFSRQQGAKANKPRLAMSKPKADHIRDQDQGEHYRSRYPVLLSWPLCCCSGFEEFSSLTQGGPAINISDYHGGNLASPLRRGDALDMTAGFARLQPHLYNYRSLYFAVIISHLLGHDDFSTGAGPKSSMSIVPKMKIALAWQLKNLAKQVQRLISGPPSTPASPGKTRSSVLSPSQKSAS
ncbi:hypothetical protein LX36DRAFT_672579 [Colletotrichum falcatum]|nr:hypothetical protein LX36DRAFT_672579 [Colletotrichum falcatum]